MGLELFVPVIAMVLTELAKLLLRFFGVHPPSGATPVVAVAAGIGVTQTPWFHTMPNMPLWTWIAFGAVCGLAAVGLHQTPRVWGLTTSRRRRRATD